MTRLRIKTGTHFKNFLHSKKVLDFFKNKNKIQESRIIYYVKHPTHQENKISHEYILFKATCVGSIASITLLLHIYYLLCLDSFIIAKVYTALEAMGISVLFIIKLNKHRRQLKIMAKIQIVPHSP